MAADILTTGEAAKILDLSTQRVRQLEARGLLHSNRTATGMRIFERCEVERVRLQRVEQKGREIDLALGVNPETKPTRTGGSRE